MLEICTTSLGTISAPTLRATRARKKRKKTKNGRCVLIRNRRQRKAEYGVSFFRRGARMGRGRRVWRWQREGKRERRWQLSSTKTRSTTPQLRRCTDLKLRYETNHASSSN